MERQLLLLGVLRGQKMHGYQLNDFLEKHFDFVTDLKPSTAYYLLDRLAARGYVTMHQEQVGNRPQRRVYEITPEGETYFFELLRQNLAGYDRPIYGDEVGLAFLNDLPQDQVRLHLKAKVQRIQQELERLRFLEEAARGASQQAALTLDHHLALVTAELKWWENLLGALQGQSPTQSV